MRIDCLNETSGLFYVYFTNDEKGRVSLLDGNSNRRLTTPFSTPNTPCLSSPSGSCHETSYEINLLFSLRLLRLSLLPYNLLPFFFTVRFLPPFFSNQLSQFTERSQVSLLTTLLRSQISQWKMKEILL